MTGLEFLGIVACMLCGAGLIPVIMLATELWFQIFVERRHERESDWD